MGLGRLLVGSACLSSLLLAGCGGGSGVVSPGPIPQVTAPAISTAAALGGAEIVTLSSSTSGATIYYTIDGSTPTTSSTQYLAPFLVASNETVSAIAVLTGETNSTVTTKAFAPNIASGTLVWSDEFTNSGSANAQPNPAVWTYDTGTDCCGNNELETYCAWGATTNGCDTSNPNAYIAPGGGLNIVARNPSGTVYTSARLKSEGLFSFQYGRLEAMMTLPESQGMWPAFWLLGNNITTIKWPACGEADVMEHIDGSDPENQGYDWVAGSVHGGTSSSSELNGGTEYHPSGFSAAASHIYGMIWTKGEIQYYVDTPSNVYATYSSSTSPFSSTTWPFDQGPQFIILNLAVGGDWPGSPDGTTTFPDDMQVDYVRLYTN